MKRIQSACLNQTIRFQQKEPMDSDSAQRANRVEFERYKVQLERSYTKYKVLAETVLEDDTLEIVLKKQYNNYDIGGYFE